MPRRPPASNRMMTSARPKAAQRAEGERRWAPAKRWPKAAQRAEGERRWAPAKRWPKAAQRAEGERSRTIRLLVVAALALASPSASGAAEGHAPTEGAAAESCLERAITAVQRRYESIRDLSARFTQTTHSVALGGSTSALATRAAGTVVFAKPGKMRWSYEQPESSLVVSDGETLWLYDPAHREAQRLRVGGSEYLSGAAIQFLLGEGEIRSEFRVTAQACAAGEARLELVPLRDASYERLRIRTDPRTGEINETTVIDLLGNVTEVAFADIRTNLDPPHDAFRFEPPDGVRVIELRPAAQ
jgi:outer membrane lipoprotein carrier protein